MKRALLPVVLVFPIYVLSFLAGGQPATTGPATEKRFPPLKVPPGFKATLFACDPLIEYPSVISIGPKPGAIFVAIDYMTGLGTDGKVKSEIRLVEDTDGDGYADKATVFAKDFNSIQGMAYHDGTLFVMHAPFLTTVHGNERKDLLSGLGLTPEQNPVRLHCANGVTIGHDGWLYLAMGDNGVNVPRPEGDRLIHHGGAILRCRPDGRDLHVFSTGLRNIYDIALDSELNVFTRDNENDGGTYMIRVCHCFHGSDHGYPYLYEQHPDEAMPPIGDFGLGSSAGGVCYLETQFPPAYRGNLFFSEWGKSIVRYPLTRSGSGFAPVKEFEFATGDSKDTYPFKPTDIVVQRDGTLMVSDYADGQRPKRGRGRIYHISFSRDSKRSADRQLDSESYYDRCEAQAAIERTGNKPSFQDLGPRGRLHAIWALAKIEGPKAIDELLQIAKTDPEPSVRAQAIRAIADLADPGLVTHKLDAGRGDAKLALQIAMLSVGQDRRVELEAVIALGRLRWTAAPAWMRRTLAKPDAALAHAWMQTLRQSGVWSEVMKSLDEGNPVHRQIALRAIADRYEASVVDGLIERLKEDKDAVHRREFADLLARVYKKPGPWKYWGYRPGPKPANTEAWERTDAILKSLENALADPDRDVRLATLKNMQREKAPISVTTLGNRLRSDFDAACAAAVLASLANSPAKEARKYLQETVLERKHSVANRLVALEWFVKGGDGGLWLELLSFAQDVEDGPVLAELFRRLGKHPKGAPQGLFAGKLGSADAEVRAAAIEALGEIHGQVKETELLRAFQDTDVRVRRAAAGAAGKVPVKGMIEPLLKLAADPDVGVRLGCLESLRLRKEPRVVPLAVAALNEPALELKALECLNALGGPGQLKIVADFGKRGPSTDGVIAAVRMLTAWRDKADSSTQKDIDRATAEIHGAAGLLVRWNVDPATPLFAVGPESRLAIPAKDANKSLWCDVAAPKATPVEFLGSSRGKLEVWLNGRSIYRRLQPAKSQLDGDRFPATLDAGINHIRVDTDANAGVAEFHLHFRRTSAKAEHEKLTQAALNRTGNAERGRKLFFDKDKSQCLKCHQLAGQGERIGPELTGVGSRFSRIHIIESILDPSRTIAPSFGTYVIALKNGKTLNGVKILETETTLTIADNQGVKHQLTKADIDEANPSPISTMPEGLEQRFTSDEFVDLIAFLVSQKDKRAPLFGEPRA